MGTYGAGRGPDRPSVLDDSDDLTVTDEPHWLTVDDTPVTARRCVRCLCVCLLGGPDDFAGGLPGMCAASEDGSWRWCRTEREIVYVVPDDEPRAQYRRTGTWRRR